jgi:hypothetical protein
MPVRRDFLFYFWLHIVERSRPRHLILIGRHFDDRGSRSKLAPLCCASDARSAVAYFHYYFPFPFTFTLATSCLYLHIPPYLKSGCSLTPSGRPPLTSRQHLLVQTKTYLLVSSIQHRIRTSRGRWRRKQGLLWEYGGVISFVGGEVDFSCGVNEEAS